MCYKCSVCQTVSKPRQSRLQWTVYRPDGQIEREYPVCPPCLQALELMPVTEAIRVRKAEARKKSDAERVRLIEAQVPVAPPKVEPVAPITNVEQLAPKPTVIRGKPAVKGFKFV